MTLSLSGTGQLVFSGTAYGLTYFPDGHFNVIRQKDGTYRVWWAGGTARGDGQTVALTSSNLVTFTPVSLGGGLALGGLGPAGGTKAFDADYAGPGSVVPDPRSSNSNQLLMFYHGENHTFAGITYSFIPYYAAIGVAGSANNGKSWVREGEIITGMIKHGNGKAVRDALGAGLPSVITAGKYFYLFYTDWNTSYADSIHVARALLSKGGAPGSWYKWYKTGFTQAGLGGLSTPVILPAAPRATTIYAGNPDVSYNSFLSKYLMLYESNNALYTAVSTDLIHWSNQTAFMNLPAGASSRVVGKSWISYATLITPGTSSDRVTGKTGYVYYAQGKWATTDHKLYRIKVSISGASVSPKSSAVEVTRLSLESGEKSNFKTYDLAKSNFILSPAFGNGLIHRLSEHSISAYDSDAGVSFNIALSNLAKNYPANLDNLSALSNLDNDFLAGDLSKGKYDGIQAVYNTARGERFLKIYAGIPLDHQSSLWLSQNRDPALLLDTVFPFNHSFLLSPDAFMSGFTRFATIGTAMGVRRSWSSGLSLSSIAFQGTADTIVSGTPVDRTKITYGSISRLSCCSGPAVLAFDLGGLSEPGSVLGARGFGGLKTGLALTAFAGVEGKLALGRRFAVGGSYHRGWTRVETVSSSIVAGVKGVTAESWSLGLLGHDLLQGHDQAGLVLTAPLQAIGGTITLDGAGGSSSDRQETRSLTTVAMKANGHERDIEAFYNWPVGNEQGLDARIGLNLRYAAGSSNIRGGDDQLVIAAHVAWRF